MSEFTRRRFVSGLAAAMALPRLAPGQSAGGRLRFGVFSLFAPQRLLLESREPLLLHLDQKLVLVRPEDRMIEIRAASGGYEVRANRTTHLAASARATSIAGEETTFTLTVPPPSLHGTIRREFAGTFEALHANGALQPVVVMQLEPAVAAIVLAESPAGAVTPYLRAQSIVSRSFLLGAHTGHHGFDFCDTTHCQFLREAPSPGAAAVVATQETYGQHLSYVGATLAAMYSRSCGGHTRTLADLGLPAAGYPYYRVPCEFCIRNPERWSRADGLDHITTERDRLRHNRTHGWSALPSDSFTRTDGRIVGVGVGHGLGLCQRGAAAMAAAGHDHREVLSHYYPNTAIS